MHTTSRPRGLLTALAGLSLVLGGTLAVSPAAAQSAVAAPVAAGDVAAASEVAAVSAAITPEPSKATRDVPAYYSERSTLAPWVGRPCHGKAVTSNAVVCEYGRASSSAYTIALVGDSKMGQYAAAFIRIAHARGWRVLIITKSACSFTDAEIDRDGAPYTTCNAWNRSALKALQRHQPDLVVTNQATSTGRLPGDTASSASSMERGLASRWRTLQGMGIPVVVVLDNPPSPAGDVYPCVAKHPTQPWRCNFSAVSGTAKVQQRAADRVGGVGVVNLRPTLCPGGVCRAVFDRVLVYRQGSHLTNTYVKTITSTIATKLDAARKVATAQ